MWERHNDVRLHLSCNTFHLIKWLTSSELLYPAKCQPIKCGAPLTLGDHVILYLAAELLCQCGCQAALRQTTAFRKSALVWLGFVNILTGGGKPTKKECNTSAMNAVIQLENGFIIEVLQIDLAQRWFDIENGKRYDGFSPVRYEVLDSIFQVINNSRDNIYIDVFSNVYRYLLEREESKIKVVKESQKEKIIQVSNQFDNEIYNIPLTLKITLSKGAIEPKVFQNGEKLNVTRKGNALLIDVIPNTGDISIKI